MGESLEVQHLRAYLVDSGVPHQVTYTTAGEHAAGSYHKRQGTGGLGLALDADDFSTPAVNTPELHAIYAVFEPVRHQLAELLGPGDPGHDNHVHVAVERGTFISYPKETPMPGNDLIAFQVAPDGQGYWFVAADGAVYAFGSARYQGGLVRDANGNWQVRQG